MKLLVVVDYQYDFVAKDGKLTCGRAAQDIEDAIYKKVKEYLDNGDDVIFTYDTHVQDTWENHPESKLFGIHCEYDTDGWEYFGKLREFEDRVLHVIKYSYGMPLDLIMKYSKKYDSIEVAGVATNICVHHNVVLFYHNLLNESLTIPLIVDAKCVASFDDGEHLNSLNYFKNVLGVNVLNMGE